MGEEAAQSTAEVGLEHLHAWERSGAGPEVIPCTAWPGFNSSSRHQERGEVRRGVGEDFGRQQQGEVCRELGTRPTQQMPAANCALCSKPGRMLLCPSLCLCLCFACNASCTAWAPSTAELCSSLHPPLSFPFRPPLNRLLFPSSSFYCGTGECQPLCATASRWIWGWDPH